MSYKWSSIELKLQLLSVRFNLCRHAILFCCLQQLACHLYLHGYRPLIMDSSRHVAMATKHFSDSGIDPGNHHTMSWLVETCQPHICVQVVSSCMCSDKSRSSIVDDLLLVLIIHECDGDGPLIIEYGVCESWFILCMVTNNLTILAL